MAPIKDLIDNIPEAEEGDISVEEMMQDPEYLRHSSQVINEALKKGYDVLQLENGDVMTTGTKIVVTQYRWNPEKGKMARISQKERKKTEQEMME